MGANIFLGANCRLGLIVCRRIAEDSPEFLEMVGLEVEPFVLVRELTVGRQQMVEIAKGAVHPSPAC